MLPLPWDDLKSIATRKGNFWFFHCDLVKYQDLPPVTKTHMGKLKELFIAKEKEEDAKVLEGEIGALVGAAPQAQADSESDNDVVASIPDSARGMRALASLNKSKAAAKPAKGKKVAKGKNPLEQMLLASVARRVSDQTEAQLERDLRHLAATRA